MELEKTSGGAATPDLRTHHTTITINHNMKKNPVSEQDPGRPDQTPAQNDMPTPSNKEGGTDHKKGQ
jgi:hypothetical protein